MLWSESHRLNVLFSVDPFAGGIKISPTSEAYEGYRFALTLRLPLVYLLQVVFASLPKPDVPPIFFSALFQYPFSSFVGL